MESKILKFVTDFSLIENASEVTVALSGGADSMSLLYVLLALKDKLGITVSAAHLNHMIRGEEAERDESFVKAECERLGVKLFTERADIPRIAEERGKSTELAAREVRYEFLERVCRGLVATAHNADDNLETVIFNLTRGSSLEGLCGIPVKRDRFIRPLLCVTRKEIEEYCCENGIDYVTDSTNLSDCYTRNKIRHKVLPVLREINPSAEQTVLRTCRQLKEISLDINKKAEEYLKNNLTESGELKIESLDKLSVSVAKQVLKIYIERSKPSISLENVHIEEVYKKALSGGRTGLPSGCYAVFSKGKGKLVESTVKGDFKVEITEIEVKNSKIHNLFLNNSLDCDKIVGKSVLRTRRSGDSIRLLNRGCTKTLNKIYNEEAVPISIRDTLPVIADEKGVIWVCGIGVAQRCAVTENTKRIKKIEVKGEV